MEFLRIQRLKADLGRRPLPAPEIAKYLAVQGALLSIVFVPSPSDAPVDWAFLAYPLVSVAGVYYCYTQNGGAAGQHFAERYLSVGWVVFVRIAFAVMPFVLAMLVLHAFTAGDYGWLERPEATTLIDVGVAVLIAFNYWRIGVHLADVHRMSAQGD